MLCAQASTALGENAGGAGQAFKFSGYYKNLLQRSETLVSFREPYVIDLNRLRLELRGKAADRVGFEMQYDNEVYFGNYLDTAQFRMQKDLPSDQYWHLERNYIDQTNAYAVHRLYRGFVTFSATSTDVRLGRQRIAWGTGRFWNPTDILNPFNPIQVEREERQGVDALLVEHKFGPLSKLSLVYAPQHLQSESSSAVQWHGNAGGLDYSAMAGRFREGRVVGLDFAGRMGEVAVRGEASFTRANAGPSYRRWILGADYVFPNTLAITAEYYHNGQGEGSTARYDFSRLLSGKVQSLARRYLGLYVGYDITPLLRLNTYTIVNLDDRSRFLYPALTYSIVTNLDATAGVQRFRGSPESEYGTLRDLYYAQLQWFF